LQEQVARFGSQNNLTGIITIPDSKQRHTTGVIILNSGLMHRVGACRFSVLLARTLVADGHPVLRFDFSGIGDSVARRDNIDLDNRNVVEVLEAIDYLSKEMQCQKFVLHGLCSGAREAFEAALRDERIIGISQIDSHAYKNINWYINYYGPRLLELSSWKVFLSKKLMGLLPSSNESKQINTDKDLVAGVWPDLPPRKKIEDGYRILVTRGVKFYVVFTGSWDFIYNYKNQFFDMYSKVIFGDTVALHFLPEADHTLQDPAAKQLVIEECRNLLRDLRENT
jgi:hypothetical protein